MKPRWLCALVLTIVLAGCAPAQAPAPGAPQATVTAPATAAPTTPATSTPAVAVAATHPPPAPIPTATATIPPALLERIAAFAGRTPAPETRAQPDVWGGWPIVPAVSPHAQELYLRGLQQGANPRAFSVIGDCQSLPEVFLGVYERGGYALGNYKYLQETIDYYNGSFNRKSAAVKDGMSVASVLSPLWNDPQQCQADETPVACELRVHRPILVFINLGTNWKNGSASAYEKYLRQVVQIVIDGGAVPVLTTKADNIEGDNSLNLATARVAYDLDIPLMNFWLASNDLPNHGLDSARENVYLTIDGWNRRNFYALVTLDALRKAFLDAYNPDAPVAP